MTKTITIGGQEIKLRCSALVPRYYRRATGNDLMRDMNTLRNNYNASVQKRADLIATAKKEGREITEDETREVMLSAVDLQMFEDLAWAFAYDADKEHTPGTPDEWLDTLPGIFSIYQVFPVIIDLWNESNKTTSEPAKK